ncbi:MAG: hypothetical protein A3F91_09845 [Flavobacteria bacterium RIFCSPLOWO2_12_FULL_35_11]|nr:MAG: hypothetical protein A3F91_09845 [Flavobacteria bacterium RIFCSPLOWO2_12_FULL_35_11]
MNYKELMGKIFDFYPSTFYTWKKQGRPIIALLEKYFSKEDLEEFLDAGSISKMEYVSKDYSSVELEFLAKNSDAVKMYIKSVEGLK